jgi:hypothetical protein
VLAETEPPGQFWHMSLLLLNAYLPAAQLVQEDWPALEYEPGAQLSQFTVPVEPAYVPAEQSTHKWAPAAAVTVENFPTPQAMQSAIELPADDVDAM